MTTPSRPPRAVLSMFLGSTLTALAALTLIVPTSDALEKAAGELSAHRATEEFEAWRDSMDAFFEANPERKTTKGSGWKPYNRAKWYAERHMENGVLPPAGARWNALQEKIEIERRAGVTPRSTWFSQGPTNFAGRMLAIAFHPNATTVYAGAAGGGVWKTTDSGASWAPMSDELASIAIGAVGLSANDPEIVVIGTGEPVPGVSVIDGVGILRSTNGGTTWETTNVTYGVPSGHGVHMIEVNPLTGTMLAGASDGLWRSTDDGANWTQVRNDGDYFDIKWKPGDANRVYAAKGDAPNGNKVKVSTDDGLTFSNAGTGQPASFLIGKTRLAVSPDDPSTVYAMYADHGTSGNLVGVYRSQNDGANWSVMSTTPNIPNGQGWYNLSLLADPFNVDRVYAGGVSLYRSVNGGVSWTVIGNNVVHVDHHDSRLVPGTNDLWVANDGGIWESTNNGNDWTDLNNGIVSYQFYDICVNNGPTSYYIMGGTQDNGTDKWSGTTVWANGLGADGMVCNISPVNGTTVYAEIQFGGHRKNTNSGSGAWTNFMSGLTGTGAWVAPTELDPNDTNHLYTSTSAGTFRSTNGSSWTNVDNRVGRWYSISPLDGDLVWAVLSNARYTTDDGSTWIDCSSYGFPTGSATRILAHPTDMSSAFVSFSTYSGAANIAMTTDLGVTWQDVSGDFPTQPVNAIVVNPSDPTQWFIGTDTGVWSSTNGGTNWLPFEAGLPNAQVLDLEIQNSLQKLVAGTHGRGSWEIDIPPTIGTDVEIGTPAALPLMLDPPAPNPIRDRAMLRFAAKHDGPVTLEVYDVSGRLVGRVAELARGDGVIRNAPWFTDDVSSGVYFAVLRAGDLRRSQKLIVAK
jgi:hypothetical protein